MKTSIIRLFDRIDPPQNIVRNQLPSGRLVGGELFDNQEQHEPEENILDQQIQLISGDKDDVEQEKMAKYAELFNAVKNGFITLQQYETEIVKLVQQQLI
ncbi:unnamed protein product [Rotaria socialis]|nr:unnamed protein product [Rotaria socialis]